MNGLRGILSATDFSVAASDAVELAHRLAAALGQMHTIVHVCEPTDEDDARAVAEGERRLAAIVDERGVRGAATTGVLRVGRASEKIANVATEIGAELIVVGQRGAGERDGLGSVAARLLRSAGRPVLTVPRRSDAPHDERGGER